MIWWFLISELHISSVTWTTFIIFVFTLFSLPEKSTEWPCRGLIQIHSLFKFTFSKYFCWSHMKRVTQLILQLIYWKIYWIPKLSNTNTKLNPYSYITALQYPTLQCCNAFDIVCQNAMDIQVFVQYFERLLKVSEKGITMHACVWTLAKNFG